MILSIEQIDKSYGKQQVLHDISFAIEEPRIVALVGPNGSGKSTLLNIIANLVPADKGKVEVLGKTNRDPEIFREFSYMQDNTILYEYLSGFDHLQFIAGVHGLSRQKIKDVAERIGTAPYLNKKVSNYSLGMKQQLLLTMAVLNKPKLLILDEPLNGLDPTNAIKVRNLLLDIVKEGTAILLSSHNLSEIDRVTSDVLFLKDGRLLEENLKDSLEVRYVLEVDDTAAGKAILEKAQVRIADIHGPRLTIVPDGTPLSRIFELMHEGNVSVIDCDKAVAGAEERYRTLFG